MSDSPATHPALAARRWPWLALALFGVAFGANMFAPMLLVYPREAGLSEAVLSGTFSVYAAGIVPGILFGGPLGDRMGRPAVVFPATAISLLATLLLVGAESAWVLLAARMMAGLASGLAFSAGSAWLLALSSREAPGVGGVRNNVALTAGFGSGPLVSGLVAQLGIWPLVLPYVPHLAILCTGIALLLLVPRRDPAARGRPTSLAPWDVIRPQIPWRIGVVAPFSFGTAVVAFTVYPARGGGLEPAAAGAITALVLFTAALSQPFFRRLGARNPAMLSRIGLLCGGLVFGLGALYAVVPHVALLLPLCVLAGLAYGGNLLYGFFLLGREPSGVQVAWLYVAAYAGFAFPALIVSLAGVVPMTVVLLGFGGLAAVALLLSEARWTTSGGRAPR